MNLGDALAALNVIVLTIIHLCLAKNEVNQQTLRSVGECTSDKLAETGDFLHVHYVGRLENGVTFDTSYNRKQPLHLQLGAKSVIRVCFFFFRPQIATEIIFSCFISLHQSFSTSPLFQ